VHGELSEGRRNRPEVSLSSSLPDEVLVKGDEHLLHRVTANLLDNALKYGGDTPIEVRAERDDDLLRLTFGNGGATIARPGNNAG